MAFAILGWSKHASRMVRFNGMNLLSSPTPKLFRDIYEGGVLQRGYMTLDSRVIGGYSSNASRASDVSTNANMMIYGKTYSSEEEKRSGFKACQDNNAFLTQHNQMCRSCTHCPNCFAHHQLPSCCCKLPSPPPPEDNSKNSAAKFFRGNRRCVAYRTRKLETRLVRQSYEGTAFAAEFAEQFENWCKKYSKTEEEKPVSLSIARLRGKGILVEEDAKEIGRVEEEWNEEIEW